MPPSIGTRSRTTVIVGNPRPASRTLATAVDLARELTGREPDHVLDLVTLGAGLLDGPDARVDEAVEAVRASSLLVVASPTYKATFTGLLKLFLERFGAGSLAGVVAVPLMLGGDWRHALAVEVHLKPVLAELGLSTPTSGLFLLDSELDSAVRRDWLSAARAQLPAELVATGIE